MKLILELAELIDEQQFRCIFLVFNVDLNQTLQRDRPPPPRKNDDLYFRTRRKQLILTAAPTYIYI